MKDTLNKQKGTSKVQTDYKRTADQLQKQLDFSKEQNDLFKSELATIQKEHEEIKKQKKIADDTNSRLTMEVQALQRIIINQRRVIFK